VRVEWGEGGQGRAARALGCTRPSRCQGASHALIYMVFLILKAIAMSIVREIRLF
jgi:hypothetical protein